MSIKYLGDNQLNQIQNDPNDTPWAKLIAQSEMLERNKMRQPQGQFPQGTVASAIQQQLLNNQMQQANQVQGLDAEKARILAQLIGSGQLQGMADGGLPASLSTTRLTSSAQRYVPGAKQAIQEYLSKENAPDVAYEDVMRALSGRGMADGGLTPSMSNPQLAPMLGASPIKPQVAQTQLAPTKEAIDQQPHHDIFQRLLDNSIIGVAQGKGSLNDTLQLYADMWTGKALKGLADGGEVRRFTEGGSLFEQLQRLKTQMAGAGQGWTPEAVAGYKSAYSPELVADMRRRGLNPSGQPLGMSDIMNRPPVNIQSAPQTTAPQSAFRAEAPRLHIGSGLPPDLIAEMHAEMRPELVGPRKGAANRGYQPMSKAAADYTAEEAAQAAKFAEAKRAAEKFSGPMKPGALSANVADMQAATQFANQMIDRPESEYQHPELKSKLQGMFGGAEDAAPREWVGKALHMFSGDKGWHAPMQLQDERTAAPGTNPTTAPTTQTQAVTKQAATRDNAKQIAQVHGYEKQDSALLNKAQQLGALAQTEAAVTQTAGDNIVDMLHKRLKDADVDYMELAKRISENEKDLAQERKDGTLTAVLTGVGAALSRAGTLEQKGDRVFTPGIGQILGAGILGGIESSEATDKKYRTGIEKNLEALNALQGLKRATANDLMDAYTAEKQNAVMTQHYKSIEDIAQQKLPAEIAELQSRATYHNAQAGAADRRGTETTDGGKPLTQAQKLTASRAAFAQAQKMMANDSNFLLKPPDEQFAVLNELAQTLLTTQIGNATGNTINVAQPTTAANPPGFNLLSSRPAK
jgi:hypothetical protein